MVTTFRGSELETKIIQQLAGRAVAGVKEAGFLADEDTGEILDYREADDATPYEVDFPEALAKCRSRVCYLHCHCVPSLPGEADWNNIVELPTVLRYFTVCADCVYVMERTPLTRNPYRVSPALIFDHEALQGWKHSSLSHLPIRQAMTKLPEEELRGILLSVNWRMSQIYSVNFKEESFA